MTGLKLCATGSYLPEQMVENDAFTAFVDTSDEWIRTRTGIASRHIADGDTAWSMGAKAAKNALDWANISPTEIDLILVTTVTPDYYTPSVSCVIQHEIGAVNAACIDLSCACAGFTYALDMARRYLATEDGIKTVLLISTELLSRITDFTDRSTCVLFGDGAGACILQAGDGKFASHLGADGSGAHTMFGKHPDPASRFTSQPLVQNRISQVQAKDNVLWMDGKEVYKFATKVIPETIEKCCAKLNIAPAQLDWIIPHQANIRIVQTAMKQLGYSMDKVGMNIDRCGNTSSASIPIVLDELMRAGKIAKGSLLGMVGFGAGLIYGGVVMSV